MAATHTISFYPVGNGDTEQIVLANERRILFDFCHRQKGENDESPEIDLKAQLKSELKAAKRDYYDVVAFTHADRDHIQGSTEFFEQRGHASNETRPRETQDQKSARATGFGARGSSALAIRVAAIVTMFHVK